MSCGRSVGPGRCERSRPRRRGPTALATFVAVALVAAACTEGASVPEDGEAASGKVTPREQLQELLDTRAEALMGEDVAGYLELLDPPARQAEQLIAEQATEMPLSEVSLQLRDVTFQQREVDGEQTLVADNAKVDFRFYYEGIPDDNPFFFRLRPDFVQHPDGWRIADSELVLPDEQTHVPMPPMWALGPTEVARSEHFLGLHRPGLGNVQAILELAERARGQLLERLTLEPAPTHVMQLAANEAQYEEIINPEGPARSVAVASEIYASPQYAPSRIPQNRHMSVNLEATFAEGLPQEAVGDPSAGHGGMGGGPGEGEDHQYEPETSPREVFQHELGHLALGRFTRATTPVWVSEGAAMQLAGEQRTTSWRVGLAEGAFGAMTFLELSGRDPSEGLSSMEYAYVNAAVSWLVEEYGADRFWEFYQGFKEYDQRAMPGGTELEQEHADATHRLLFRVYDMGEEALDQRAREWMRQETNQG